LAKITTNEFAVWGQCLQEAFHPCLPLRIQSLIL
jgi:hypothetical protein